MTTLSSGQQDAELIVAVQQALQDLEQALADSQWEHMTALNEALNLRLRTAVEQLVTPEAKLALRDLLEQCQTFYGRLVQQGTEYRNGLAQQLQQMRRSASAANKYLESSGRRG